MLVTEPVVFFFSLWVSFSWAVLYLQFGSIPLVFKTNHEFNIEQTGAVFTCTCPTPAHPFPNGACHTDLETSIKRCALVPS
jgi:hypothetical protein